MKSQFKNLHKTATGMNHLRNWVYTVFFAVLAIGYMSCNYDEIPDDIVVIPTTKALNASFSMTGGQLWQKCPISFSVDSINMDNTYSWNFGDNQTSTETNPEHVYNNPGTYTVRLTVSDGTRDTAQTETVIIYQTRKFENTRVLGSGVDSYREIIPTQDGEYMAFGVTTSIGAGFYDIYMAKIEDNGTMVWEKTFGGPNSDYGADFIEVDNGYMILGSTDDPFLMNVDHSGTVVNQYDFPQNGNDAFWENSVIQTSDGGYAIAGQSKNGVDYTYSMGMIKADASGNLQWKSEFIPVSGYGYASSLVETLDGGFIVAGEIDSKIALVKSDAGGNLQWHKTIGTGGTSHSGLSKIVPAIDGGYVVCGTESDNNGDRYAFIAKIDESGNLVWDKTFGGPSSIFRKIDVVEDEGYIFSGIDGNTTTSIYRAFMVKVNKNGALNWEKQYNTSSSYFYGVSTTPDCGFISVGSANSGLYMVKTDSDGHSN